jgi:hypothetical protein
MSSLQKRLGRHKIGCVAYGFIVSIMLYQGIKPQGYGLMPYRAVLVDRFFGIGIKKGKMGH